MPGMFGIVSNDIEKHAKFRELNHRYSPYRYNVKSSFNWCVAAHAYQGPGVIEDKEKIIAVDGDYSIYNAVSTSPESLYVSNELDIIPSEKCTGNICILDKKKATLYLAADLLGSFPLYYATKNDSFIFSSRIKPFGKYLQQDTDATGIFGYLFNGYNIDNRTFYSDVFRVRPGELVKVNVNTLELSATSYSELWAAVDELQYDEDLVDVTSRLLAESFSVDIPTMLMMSAGWDSRTILAAGLLSENADNLIAYSHGDLSSREINIVSRICEDNSINLAKQQICSEMFAVEALKRNLYFTENTIYPHWHWAGETAKLHNIKKIAAGVYGEALGGHYGPPWALSGTKKMLEVFRYLLNLQSTKPDIGQSIRPIEKAFSLLKPPLINKPWYINDEYWDSFNGLAREKTAADVESVLSRYQRRGVKTVENFIEAFVTEHRGAQYITSQLLSCRHYVDVCLPFAEPEFIKFTTRLPFALKVHNIMNKAIIGKIAPQLLRYPMAATLVPAKYPMVLQETSRILRKLEEEGWWKLHKITNGYVNEPKMGWVNFQFLGRESRFADVVDILQQPFWDRGKMHSYIDKIEYRSLHPLADMLMKILTVDYCVSE